MSLFSICGWWQTQCADLDENYDSASLLCARFGLTEQEKDYIVVGTHAGHLSIFYPNPQHADVERNGGGGGAGGGGENGFKPTDLLLETQLDAPILGIYAGRFSGNARDEKANQLAVLQPTALLIYHMQSLGGVAEHGTQMRLQQLANYRFQRVAFAFCKGHFGKVKGREFFCIVHMDGTLTFYEQDGITYECQFPGHRCLPSPVVYCERTDSFCRFGSTWQLECYTYQDLSHWSINKAQVQPVWSVCLGEGIVDMCVVQANTDSSSILILGERNFLCLRDTGSIDFILKLDYAPRCFHSFIVGYYWEPTARLITAIVSDNAKLFIYDGANIIWAAQYMDAAPVALQRSNVNGLPGAIVTLGSTGQLRIGYLGSDAFVFKAPPHNVEQLTFGEVHKELLKLEDEIKEAVDVQDMTAINRRAYDDVHLTFTMAAETTDDLDTLLLDIAADVAMRELPACRATLKLKSRVELAELQVCFQLPDGIRCTQEAFSYVDVAAGQMEQLELDFYIAELGHMYSARVDAIVSFVSHQGIPRVIQQAAYLPLAMFFKVRQPQKAAGIKLTYRITSPSVSPKMSILFPEFVTWDSDAHALGLQLICPGDGKADEVITVVAAKNSNRLRIQSDSLEAFPMILERLIQATEREHERNAATPSLNAQKQKPKTAINSRLECIRANPVLPITQILHKMDLHHESQENIRKQTAELDELWAQFKILQRKLQEKSDDEPKETLVMQIEENYDHLIAEGDKLTDMRKDERRCDLSCAIGVARSLIACLHLEEKVVRLILSVLCAPVEDWTELSWEEAMSPGIDMLHHYGPLSRGKSGATVKPALTDASAAYEHFDYGRFRRHFATLFERVVHIASLEEPPAVDLGESVEQKQLPSAEQPPPTADINGLNQVLVVAAATSSQARSDFRRQQALKRNTLEAVEDDNEEYDEEDLRAVGYKKEYGPDTAAGAKIKEHDNEAKSDWVNEEYELPTSEQLFNDLGIWW